MVSALYVLIAVGFTLIFGVGGVLNFSHGALITTGAFAGYLVANPARLDWGPIAGLLAGLLVAAIIAAVMYLSVIRYIQDRMITVLIVTLVIGFLLQDFFRGFITDSAITSPRVVEGSILVLGQDIQYMHMFVFIISWIIILSVLLFVTRTNLGMAVVATSINYRGAKLAGIRTQKINLYVWILAGAFAGLAGVLLMMLETGGWRMGIDPLIFSFAIVVLGGLGSIKGTIVGAHLIGFIETMTIMLYDPQLQGLSSLIVLLLVILLKPKGLYGKKEVEL